MIIIIVLMEQILHQLIWIISHVSWSFKDNRWLAGFVNHQLYLNSTDLILKLIYLELAPFVYVVYLPLMIRTHDLCFNIFMSLSQPLWTNWPKLGPNNFPLCQSGPPIIIWSNDRIDISFQQMIHQNRFNSKVSEELYFLKNVPPSNDI